MVSAVRLENYIANDEYVPQDKLNIVFCLVTLVGFGVLMPWNMFITIAPEYYVNYWFKLSGNETWYSKEFMSSLTIAAQLPNATVNIFNLFLVIGGPLIYRVFAPVCFNLVNVSVVLVSVIMFDPSSAGVPYFFWSTLGLVMLINFSNGLYENSVFGVFADFPYQYTGAILIGNNLCGLLITFIKLAVTLLIPSEVKLTAIVYFSISLGILALCGVALFVITQQEFYHFYHEKGIEIRKKADAHKPSMAILWTTFKSCYEQLFNVWFTFAVTLTIFPVMMTTTKKGEHGLLNSVLPENEEVYTLITTFLIFNLFATIGAVAASKIQFPSPKYLIYAVLTRALLLPIFFFCNYRVEDRVYPVYFKSTDVFVICSILMSFTQGYFSSLAMAYTPKVVSPHHSRFAAQLSACTLMIGLFSGAMMSLVVENVVDRSFF